MGTAINNGKTFSQNTADLSNEVKGVAQDVSDVSSKTKDAIRDAKSKADNFAAQARDVLGDVSTQAKDMAQDYLDNGSRYVQENPVKSVAIALAAGVVIGGALGALIPRRQ